MSSRFRPTENGDAEAAGKRGLGLSEYTSQRLAELRARRAAAAREDAQEFNTKPNEPTHVISKESAAASIPPKPSPASKPSPMESSSTISKPTPTTNGTGAAHMAPAHPVPVPRSRETGAPTTHLESYSAKRATPNVMASSNTSVSNGPDLTREYKEYKVDYSSKEYRGGGVTRNPSMRATPERDEDDCVGFASLPDQVHRKALKRGFDFTLMVVGESGLGKSTLVQSLFLNCELYNERTHPPVQDCLERTVKIEKKYMEIEEKGVRLRLTIVDTPGFNDSVSSKDCWKPINDYIDAQFDQYFQDESGLSRKNIKDSRVHCCLYFVSPYGHGLRQIDIEFMKQLHDKVNIVPIIAKSDTLTAIEVRKLKSKVLEQIEANRIKIYEFPECDSDEDEEFKRQDKELKASIPFAVIGSNTVVEVNGKKIRGRLYPWGIVEVDNPKHCDFLKLRQMLINTHMQDLKDVTMDVHYENFRAKHLTEQMSKQAARERNGLTNHRTPSSDESKLKRDSSPNFEAIMATDSLLQQKDAEIRKMQEMLAKMQAQLGGNNNKVAVNGGLGNL